MLPQARACPKFCSWDEVITGTCSHISKLQGILWSYLPNSKAQAPCSCEPLRDFCFLQQDPKLFSSFLDPVIHFYMFCFPILFTSVKLNLFQEFTWTSSPGRPRTLPGTPLILTELYYPFHCSSQGSLANIVDFL